MKEKTFLDDFELINRMRKDDQYAFSVLFIRYYSDLLLYCGTFIANRNECEDIIQSIFLELWEKRKELNINTSLKSFLLRAVRHDCYDAIKHHKIVENHLLSALEYSAVENWDVDDYVTYSELESQINTLLEQYDKKSVDIFRMSRFQYIKYDDIAEEMNVSKRTIEVRIGNVLKYLKNNLKEFLPLLLITLIIAYFTI